MTTPFMNRLSTTKSQLALILGIAVLLRVGAAIYLGDKAEALPGTFDQISYHTLAIRLLNGHGFTFGRAWWPATPANAPTAHWSFLYTFYLTAVYAIANPHPLIARLIQAVVVGIIHPYLIFRLGEQLFNRQVGLVAAAITAIYIYFIYYAGTLMTEPFYITAILAVLYVTIRLSRPELSTSYPLAISLGLLLAITLLFRQLFALFVPFLFLWLWWVNYQQQRRLPIGQSLVAIAIVAVLILPFTLYNYSRFHRFVLLNTNAGYAFFWANHPIHGTNFIPILPPEKGSYYDLIPVELRSLDEAALDTALLKQGLAFVSDDPIRYLKLSLSRIPAYFIFWPSPDSGLVSNISRVASFGLFLPFMVAGFIMSLKKWWLSGRSRWSDPILLIYLFMACYTLIHLLSWALVRYRLPVDSLWLLFAPLPLLALRERLIKSHPPKIS